MKIALRSATNESEQTGREAGDEKFSDKMMSELKTIIGDAERLLKLAAETSSDGLATARTQFNRQMGWTRNQLGKAGKAGKAVKQNARHSTAVARGYVKENPLRSVGVATAAGMLVGLVVVSYLSNRRQ